MRDGQLGLLHDAVAEADNVQVQRPGAPPDEPFPPALPLDRLQVIEERGWLERGLEQHHLVQVGALRYRSEGGGLLDARDLEDPTVREGGEPVACVRQMRRAIAHVRPERHVHPFPLGHGGMVSGLRDAGKASCQLPQHGGDDLELPGGALQVRETAGRLLRAGGDVVSLGAVLSGD